MMRAPILLLVATMYAPSSSIRAQEPDLGLFESNYIVFANPTPNQIGAPSYYDEVGDGGNLITETQIITHFRWLRGLNREVLAAGQGGWKANVLFTFQFRLRALQDASNPIRSPSYMPRLTGQLMKAYGGNPGSPNAGRRNVVGFVGGVGHHSNGGDWCVFAVALRCPVRCCRRSGPRRGPMGSRRWRKRTKACVLRECWRLSGFVRSG